MWYWLLLLQLITIVIIFLMCTTIIIIVVIVVVIFVDTTSNLARGWPAVIEQASVNVMCGMIEEHVMLVECD